MKQIFLKLVATALCCISANLSFAQGADGAIEVIEQMGQQEIQDIQNNWGQVAEAQEHILEGIEQFGNFLQIAESGLDLYNASQALDNDECVPDFTTDAQGMMPSSCDEDAGCAGCYQEAINRLTTVRKSLARMSCIYMNTKNFTQSAIAFGDNVAGIHGVTGLAWQSERKGIQQAYENFKRTYDRKYVDLMNSLQISLNKINECEAKFGVRDWYQKFGFMYFEMMKEKYKRND
jgi:hypothetical protein